MLAVKRSAGVTLELNLSEGTLHMPPPSVNKAPTLALKSGGDVTRNPKQGKQWPHKRMCVQQNFIFKMSLMFVVSAALFCIHFCSE